MGNDHKATLQKLIDLGYLKYVPASERQAVQQQLLSSMNHGIIESEWGRDCVASDRRGYPADNEELAQGRIGVFLLLMKSALAEEGIRLDSVEDDFQDDHYDVLVNGERFRVYGRAVNDSWAISLRRFLEIVNDLLQRAASKERLFGIYAGNDGRVILLTEEMHECLSCLPWIDGRWMPYKPDTIGTQR